MVDIDSITSYKANVTLPLSDIPQGGIEIPEGDQADFQVDALFGSIFKNEVVHFGIWIFNGQESGWSNTQTITVDEADALTTPIATPALSTPTSTPTPITTFAPLTSINPYTKHNADCNSCLS